MRSVSRFARSSPAWTVPTSESVRRPSQMPLRGCWTLRSVRRPSPAPHHPPWVGCPGVGGGRDPRGLERLRGTRCRDGRMETWGAEIGDRGMTTSGTWCQGKQFSPSPCLPLPDYEERGQLHDAFTQMTHSLQEMATAQGSFRVAFLRAAEKMQKIILQLKEVQVCIPPCGLQEVTRRFRCRGCYSKVCDLPLDCPVQDLTVTRGRQAMFSCTVNFQLPKEEITYSWKFAGARASRSSGLKIQPTSEIFRGPKVTWRGSGQCSPRTAGPSLA
ncbi:sperm acrosome membrane-associated protein 6 isoform X2 [Bos indicus]|uniref:Sperm acrosome membrane-associated protein 6 isoform X2 n=1 Tax=Bos indicus TaxID=9915 RepID=A0ABM4QWF2_BOSIN